MTVMDAFAPVMGLLGIAFAAFVASMAQRAIKAFELRTGIDLTAQQQQTVRDAVQTAAGTVMARLAGGQMAIADVRPLNDVVTNLAQAALLRVSGSAAALGGVTARSLAEVIVGNVGNQIAQDPTVPTVATKTSAALDKTFTPAIRPAV